MPKWAVVIAAALLFLPLAVDWVQPGEGAKCAIGALGMRDEGSGIRGWMVWSWLVGLAGRDVAALGAISVGAGLVCVWLVAAIFGAIFGAAVRKADVFGRNEFPFVKSAAVLLAGLAFALTPGFLAAATRVSPLMVALVPGLAAVAIVLYLASRGGDAIRTIERFKKGWYLVFIALGLLGYSAIELILARRVFLAMAFPAVWVWLAVGVMPALVIAWCVRKRWLLRRKALWGAFGGWAFAIAVMGSVAVFSGKLNEGRVASRIVERIIANAEESGKIAIVSDGGLDELFFFMLPERMKLISLARERDPAYGRELSDWIKRTPITSEAALTLRKMRNVSEASEKIGVKTNIVEDLAFAAELGPRALIDEWLKIDKPGFEAKVATPATYFPTREKWDEARAMIGDGSERRLRRLMAVCGNALGCALIERGDLKDAWTIFKAIVDEVEPGNYAAYLNLLGMVQRGFVASKDEVADLTKRRQQIEKNLKSWERILGAARSGGRLYADPEDVAKYEKAQKEMAAKRELSPEAKALVEAVVAAPKDAERGRAAQEAIHKAIREGKVRTDRIGGRLITIDLALGDRENAEKDAIDVLKLDRHEPTANAALGSLAMERGDYERAERYLRRAIATGKASAGAKNDLAWTLYRLGKLDEAEPFAREAVRALGGSWALRETLAAILIRAGRTEEGERELAKAEELAEKAGVPKGRIVSIEIDRARILKAKEDYEHLKMAMRKLKARKDLTEEQKAEVKGMDW